MSVSNQQSRLEPEVPQVQHNGQKQKKGKARMKPVNGEVHPPQQFNILENGDEKLKQSEQQKKAMSKKTGNYEKTCSASTSAGIPSPILDPLAEDLDYPDSEVAWRNARRIDNPYQGLFRQVPLESVGQDIVAEVMNGKMTEWDRKYQNRMIPLDTLGLEILSGQIRVLHLCVKQWKNKSTEKHYRNENRREQILSLAEECGLKDRVYKALDPIDFEV
ncbi:unnamed protein product [Oikopleura dioica]|uniref:Uncharacterized protein n=1 Tax=Oikopleura dioica TaxID=34765 RepID=E4XYG9_OIKDI|nr:unnamed protein product [Oikopleura dioica]CBY30637.1 unnamed protein product [Oikopleura dioica]